MFASIKSLIRPVALLVGLCTLAFGAQSVRADGLIIIRRPPIIVPGHFTFAPLEVTYHHVDTKIDEQLAQTSVDQEFYNPNGARLEGDYIFPVPKDAQINKFAMDVDGKTMEAELLPADKARTLYEEIVRQVRDPALLEYAGRSMFHVRIFPIEPNGRKHITLKYTELLKSDSNLMDYHYTLNTEKYSSRPLNDVSIKVAINCSQPITTLYSPTHEVEVTRKSEMQAVVGYEAKNVRPDTDFHLYIGRKAAPVGISLLTYKPDADKDGYFVMLAAPTISKDIKPTPKDVVFVVDTSGSMAGAKMEQTKKALKFCVNTLNPDDHFDIVRFSTEAEPLFKSVQPADADNRKKATDFAEGLKATGGTAIADALAAALTENTDALKDRVGPPRVFLVVFMTDGMPTIGEENPDKLLAAVKDNPAARNVRFFTFGVGNDVNAKLLDLLAEETRAASQYVLPNEDIEVAVSNFFGKVSDPFLTALKLDTGPVTTSKLYPKALPDLFKGDQLVVFGTYAKGGKGALTITGSSGSAAQKFSEDADFPDKTDGSKEWIGKLWAVRRVGYLLDEIRLHGESKELKDEVTQLARQWAIVTPYTAMLIMEDERARGVAANVQSLRDFSDDRAALAMNRTAVANMGQQSGASGVNSAMNLGSYKEAKSLESYERASQQSEERIQVDNGSAMARRQLAAAAPASTGGYVGGVGGGGGGAMGGRGRGGGSTGGFGNNTMAQAGGSFVQVDGAKLGVNGSAASGADAAQAVRAGGTVVLDSEGKAQVLTGYRVMNNYAQQNRVVNNRAFYLNQNQWTDANVQNADAAKAKHVKVEFGSDDYFKLIQEHPETAGWLALGTNVTFELGGVVYEVAESKP